MSQCRIIISTECNLTCEYCCNRIPEIQDQFKMRTLADILKTQYDVYNITGGEPFLDPNKLYRVCRAIKQKYPMSHIFINTNGTLINGVNDFSDLRSFVTGYNLGYHKGQDLTQALTAFDILSQYHSVRFHIQNNWMKNRLEPKEYKKIMEIKSLGKLKEWVMNECDVDGEDRFII